MGGNPSPEGGEFGDRLIMPLVSMASCPPVCLSIGDHASVAGLGCGLCLARNPHGLAGLKVRAHAVDCHGSVALVDVISLQGQGSPATIPCGSLPSVTLGTAAIEILCIHQVIMLGFETLQSVGDELVVGQFGFVHAVSLQGQGGRDAP